MTHPVPLLDLAPKRKTPLSLWNPLDYLVLLYWVFFFPQAIDWYIEKFELVKTLRILDYSKSKGSWRKFLQLLRNDPIQRNLLVHGFLLTLFTVAGINLINQLFLPINWFLIIFFTVYPMVVILFFGTTNQIESIVVTMVILGITCGVIGGVVVDATLLGVIGICATFVIGLSIVSNLTISISGGITFRLGRTVLANSIIALIIAMFFIVTGNLVVGITIGVCSIVFITRLPDFLITCLCAGITRKSSKHPYPIISRTTWLPLPSLQSWLRNGLEVDSPTTIQNIDQLLRYSIQFIPVIQALNNWLVSLPEPLICKQVDTLSNLPYDWDIVRFGASPLSAAIWRETIFFLPDPWKDKISHRWDISLHTDTHARAACAGYWLMHQEDTAAAIEAFSHNRHILHGETLYQTARSLDFGRKAETLQNVVTWENESNWLDRLQEEPLRPQSIATLRRLHDVAREASVAAVSYSKLNRNAALGRAVATLTELLDDLDTTCPELERPIVREIAEKWRDILAREAGKAGQIAITKPVENPFVVGNPVSGAVFVGREEILRRIEELWGNSATQSVPSLVIFGHRRMGKSSILQNLGERRFGVNTIVAQFTMQRAGRLQSTGELLAIFATCIHEALAGKGINVPEPDFATFERSPYKSFNSFLAAVKRQVSGQRVILTIDEFELIEDAIQKGAVDAELLAYLRGVIHSEHWFVLALAGLHTLEEMAANYWDPLFSSVTPVRVSFLSWEATANLLANPTDDFPLDFTREAIDCVYTHVRGQPFLTQLIGHTLVRLYNQSVFENQTPREARFSAADVDEVVGRPEFYEQGHYYFQGVWSQAQSGPQGQLALLQALAQADGSLAHEAWLTAAGLDKASLAEDAVNTLLQHDVVLLTPEDNYDFAVPLMRRWLRK